MKPRLQVKWDWLDEAGQLRWEVARNDTSLADSGGFVTARSGLLSLLDLAAERDDAGDDEAASVIMDQWVEIAWEIKDRVDAELAQTLEEACDEWWETSSDDN